VTDDQGTQTEERDDEQAAQGQEGESDAMASAKKAKEEEKEAKKKIEELEDDPPERLEDWPDDKAKYETFGGAEGNESYEESVTSKLGPSGVRHRDDGSVEVDGEKVDNPEDFKGDPIPGGPTDPRASDTRAYGEPDLTDETSVDVEGKDDDGDESSERDGSDSDSDEGESEGEGG
jgi:hypothetical protein